MEAVGDPRVAAPRRSAAGGVHDGDAVRGPEDRGVLQRLSATSPVEDVTAVLERDGAVIVDEVIDADLLDRFNSELDPLLEVASPSNDREFVNSAVPLFFGAQTRHVTGVAAKSATFATEIMVHPMYLGVADAVLGGHCASYQLNLAQVMDRGPGSDRQILHRDEDVWIHMPRPHPELQFASVIALVDFTKENGATVVAPGSHRWARERQPVAADLAVAEMPAGSAVLYLGSTIHGGGANSSSQWRRGMHLSYVLGWLRTEENHYLATPPDVARSLPRRSQEVLGYAAHDALDELGGYLGTVELQDPVELLARGWL
ncbi:MAG: phytanoyl-CoA dioxygenase family protein [Acidimicrobiales bacterium]